MEIANIGDAHRLHIKHISEHSKEVDHIRLLYKHAFPVKERSPFHELLSESGEFIAFYDAELFVGFASLLTYRDITHILYFAIDNNLRGHGYGTGALNAICEHLMEHRIIVDIEMETDKASNNEQRRKRKQFYLNSGYKETGIKYIWQEEHYEILVRGGDLSDNEFEDFWHHFKLEGESPNENIK